MSIRVMSWVWEHSAAEGIELLVLLAIADHASDDGSDAWPSVETLAKKTRVSPRTVQRAVRSLEARGELSVKIGGGRGGSNGYTVNLSPRQSDTVSGRNPVNVTPVNLSPVTQLRHRGGDTAMSPEPSLNHPTPLTPRKRGDLPDCCDKHSKYRNNCRSNPSCKTMRARRIAAEADRERQRSDAVFEDFRAAAAVAVPRPPKDQK